MNLWSLFHQLNSKPIEILEGRCHKAGSEINIFGSRQLATEIFFSRQMEKCGCQKVLVKRFPYSETQAKIIGRHRLAGKLFAIDVIRNRTSAEIIF